MVCKELFEAFSQSNNFPCVHPDKAEIGHGILQVWSTVQFSAFCADHLLMLACSSCSPVFQFGICVATQFGI